MIRSCIIFITLHLVCGLQAQEVGGLAQVSLEEAILLIEEEHRINFSYSKDIVPYQAVVELDLAEKSLPKVLESLTLQTGINYRKRGRRVVLNYNPVQHYEDGISEPLDQISLVQHPLDQEESEKGLKPSEISTSPDSDNNTRDREANSVISQRHETLFALRERTEDYQQILAKLEAKDPRQIKTHDESVTIAKVPTPEDELHLAQFSLVPLPTTMQRKTSRTYRVSVNAVAGVTGGVRGLEVGGFYNGIKRDLHGLQIAGAGNFVRGNVHGGQVAGFANLNKGIVRGIQVGGWANINYQADAIQFAGMFNYNREVSRGLQGAGLFNISRNIAGSQGAGLFNFSSGDIDVQVAGFANIADHTDIQVSGGLNIARSVDYFQIGLINVADTVGGATFGLINLIRRGYNKVEFSTSEALYGNVAVKLGTKKFYNIFQLSSNFQRNLSGNGLIWGYGYGFGFLQRLGRNIHLNPEILATNIHERSLLQPDLNLLNQGKLLFLFNNGNKTEFFAGPTFNFSISKLRQIDSNRIGTSIAPYALWDVTYFRSTNSLNTKTWIGFSAGLRI